MLHNKMKTNVKINMIGILIINYNLFVVLEPHKKINKIIFKGKILQKFFKMINGSFSIRFFIRSCTEYI